MKQLPTSGPEKPAETRWAYWTKWAALILIVACTVYWSRDWWMPDSDDMRRFKADLATCKKSASAEIQLQACTRLVVSGWLNKRGLADTLNNRGVALWRLDRFQEALTNYDGAIDLDPRHDSAYVNRGNSYAFLKKDDLAIADYTRAIEINPSDDFAYMNRGTSYFAKGDYKQAILNYDHAIMLKPNNALLRVQRGHAWRRIGEDAKADADFAAARAIDPKIVPK
ncbi:MAG: tetratricopeptide repeat protein [Rhodospirillales bacterium]